MSGYWRSEWFGDEIAMRLNRAAGRAVVAMGERVTVETKRVTHVDSGTLRRSVHTAPHGYEGSRDEQYAESTDVPNHHVPERVPEGWAIEVGSWLPYACVEWVGRGHPGVTQGLEAARPSMHAIVNAAVREEGLH